MIARTMWGQWEVLLSHHWLFMGIGGHVPPLLGYWSGFHVWGTAGEIL